MSRKGVLWVVVLLVAFGVGFGLGVALWEEDAQPHGPPRAGIATRS